MKNFVISRPKTPWQLVQHGAIWPILPFAFMIGILVGEYFSMTARAAWVYFLICAVLFVLMSVRVDWRARNVLIFFALGFASLARLGMDFDLNKTVMFESHYYGAIEGRVVGIDQSYSEKMRVTLDGVELDGRPVYGKVRISLHGQYHREKVKAGAVMQATGLLSPVNGNLDPGGYDFRRKAWNDGIAAVGYTRNPALFSTISQPKISELLLNYRVDQSRTLTHTLGRRIGGFAAAVYVGEKSSLDRELSDDMRKSNLSHVLAISGMHMGIVCSLAFFLCRRVASFVPQISSTQLPNRIAVVGALLATTVYWLFSGMSFSATRAFFMGVIFLMAMIWGRKVFSLRSLSLVFTGLLIVEPMALFDIGFQMSFMATMALVVGFEMVPVNSQRWRGWVRWLLVLGFTSLVAGFATAPFGAYHFNVLPKFGLIGNMFAVPAMGTLVLPGLAGYTFLAPFGFGDFALRFVEIGITWIAEVARQVASQPEPIWRISAAHPLGLFFVLSSYLSYAFFRNLKFMVALLIVGVCFWGLPERASLFIANDARFFGVMVNGERVFSHEKGHSFLAEIWANRDGSALNQSALHFDMDNNYQVIALDNGWRLVYSSTTKSLDKVAHSCEAKTILVAARADRPSGDCIFINEDIAQDMGGVAIDFKDGEAKARPISDQRPKPWRKIAQTNDKTE